MRQETGPAEAPDPDGAPSAPSRGWFLIGALGAFTLPALVLAAAMIGFGGLAREGGFTLPQSLLMTATIWALPSMVVLVSGIAGGAGLLATAIAVSLTAVRLMPMTVALVPVMRMPRTPTWKLLLLSHFVAVTAWVEALARLPKLPREGRLPYFAGFAPTLVVLNIGATAVGYGLSNALPLVLAAALMLLTPVYFLLTLTKAASSDAERFGMGLGLVCGPVAYMVVPGGLDLLVSGLVAGTLAFALHRARKTKRRG